VANRVVRAAATTPDFVALGELHGLGLDTEAIARALSQPVLWISAAPQAEQTDGAGVAKHFKKVDYGQTVGAGHFPQLEVPDQINAMMARFISQL
jgi:pimeloyl-ACP methyl ester carboxylesterase